jgi:two-component system NarL family response regulator
MAKIRIAVVDDHEIVRHGLKLSLELEPDMTIVGEARTGKEAVEVAKKCKADVMLLDVRLEDIDGPEVCRRVIATTPHTSVIMLTNYLQDDLVFRSLVAGAKGYVIKDVELGELKRMIRSVHRGNAVLDPKVTTPVISSLAGAGTSPADHRRHRAIAISDTDVTIIRLVSEGLTNHEIAEQVHLSPHTVKDHVEKLCDLFNVRSRTAVVTEALKRGIL